MKTFYIGIIDLQIHQRMSLIQLRRHFHRTVKKWEMSKTSNLQTSEWPEKITFYQLTLQMTARFFKIFVII